jgi:hypothetical protein
VGCGWIKFFSRSVGFLANFWTALIFASWYQDKEDRKRVNTNEEEAYKDSVLELLDIYSNDRPRKPCGKLQGVY